MSDKLTEVQFDSQPMIAEIYSKNKPDSVPKLISNCEDNLKNEKIDSLHKEQDENIAERTGNGPISNGDNVNADIVKTDPTSNQSEIVSNNEDKKRKLTEEVTENQENGDQNPIKKAKSNDQPENNKIPPENSTTPDEVAKNGTEKHATTVAKTTPALTPEEQQKLKEAKLAKKLRKKEKKTQ